MSQQNNLQNTADSTPPTNKNCAWVLNTNLIGTGAMGIASGGVSYITSVCPSTKYMAGIGVQFNGANNAQPVVPAVYCCSL